MKRGCSNITTLQCAATSSSINASFTTVKHTETISLSTNIAYTEVTGFTCNIIFS